MQLVPLHLLKQNDDSLRLGNRLQRLDHDNTVSPDNHHSNISLVVPIDLNSVIHHQIHELVKPSKCANNNTVCIQLDLKLLVHVLLEIRRLPRSAHGGDLASDAGQVKGSVGASPGLLLETKP